MPKFSHLIVHFNMEKSHEVHGDESGEGGGWHIFTGTIAKWQVVLSQSQGFKWGIFRNVPNVLHCGDCQNSVGSRVRAIMRAQR